MENLDNNTNITESNELKDSNKSKQPKKEKKAKKQKKVSIADQRKEKFKYPDAINSNSTTEFYNGTGRLWDNVLEYKVEEKSFSNHKEALEYANEKKLTVMVLIEQLPNHWIKETESSISLGKERRVTQWKPEDLFDCHYSIPKMKRELGKAAKLLVDSLK